MTINVCLWNIHQLTDRNLYKIVYFQAPNLEKTIFCDVFFYLFLFSIYRFINIRFTTAQASLSNISENEKDILNVIVWSWGKRKNPEKTWFIYIAVRTQKRIKIIIISNWVEYIFNGDLSRNQTSLNVRWEFLTWTKTFALIRFHFVSSEVDSCVCRDKFSPKPSQRAQWPRGRNKCTPQRFCKINI